MSRLTHTVELSVSVADLFAWYTDVRNVARMTPSEMHLRILRAETPLALGSRVLFAIRPRFVPFEIEWLLQVVDFKPNASFSEKLLKGPFEHWLHRHEFEDLGNGRCRVTDTIEWEHPAWLVRAVATPDFIDEKLRETFAFREQVMRRELQSKA